MATNPEIRSLYQPYPNNAVNPNKESPDGIFILLKDPRFMDWVIEAIDLQFVDLPDHPEEVKLTYGYSIATVPKGTTDENINKLRPELQEFVGKVLFDILEVTAASIEEKQE